MKIAVLLADAFQDPEYFLPKHELERAGARTEVISLDSKPVEIFSYFSRIVPTYFMDLAKIAGDAPPAPEVTTLGRFRENLGVVLRSLPDLLSLKRPGYALRLTCQAVP